MINGTVLVQRRLSTGLLEDVGRLAENKEGTYFQYEESYLSKHNKSISPFKIENNLKVQKAERHLHGNLHGVFADSLPGSWGNYLIEKKCQELKRNPRLLSPLEKLLIIGSHGTGALIYDTENYQFEINYTETPLSILEKEAISVFEFKDTDHIDDLINASGAGGSRPKLNLIRKPDYTYAIDPSASGTPVILKLASKKLPLGENEPLVEFLYLEMAMKVGINVPKHDFIIANKKDSYNLELERFDCTNEGGRLHVISACGLLDAPSEMPSLDYLDLIKSTYSLCGPADAKEIFKRALFNFLTCNQDDHSKNFSFISNDHDEWKLAPMYDITFSPSYRGSHMTTFMGYGSSIPKHALDKLSMQAGLSGFKAGLRVAEEIYEVVRKFHKLADDLDLDKPLIRKIQKTIDQKWKELPSK